MHLIVSEFTSRPPSLLANSNPHVCVCSMYDFVQQTDIIRVAQKLICPFELQSLLVCLDCAMGILYCSPAQPLFIALETLAKFGLHAVNMQFKTLSVACVSVAVA